MRQQCRYPRSAWRVELWVVLTRTLCCLWRSRRAGQWQHLATVYTVTWDEIPLAVARMESAGMYHRLGYWVERWEQEDEADDWLPVDHV